jgi:DNA polymerase
MPSGARALLNQRALKRPLSKRQHRFQQPKLLKTSKQTSVQHVLVANSAPWVDHKLSLVSVIKKGEPFVGRAGQLLTKIIEAIGLTREQVYIANVLKCRPPGNRNPETDEVEQCEPFLFRQIDVIQPKVIVPLGKFAAQSLLRTMDPITRLRGRSFDFRGATLIPTFHPAYLLRNPSAKREVWEDMKKVRAILQAEA